MGCASSTDAEAVATPSVNTAATTATPSASQLHSAARAPKAQGKDHTASPRRSPAGSSPRRRAENPLESDPLLSPALYSVVPRHAPAPPPIRHGPSPVPPLASPTGSRHATPTTTPRTSRPSSPRRHGPQPQSPVRGALSSPLASGHGSVVLNTPEPALALSSTVGMRRPPRAPSGAAGAKPPSGAGSFGSRAGALMPHKRHSGSSSLFGTASQLSATYGSLSSSSRSGRYNTSDASASTGPSEGSANITPPAHKDDATDAQDVGGSVPAAGVSLSRA